MQHTQVGVYLRIPRARQIKSFFCFAVWSSRFYLATSSMAEAPDVVEKGLEELEEEITCPVCQEHFREPKILTCLHYYCKECVRQLAARAGPNRPFACPECRSGTVLPQNDPDQLRTAFFVNRMKELHAKMEKTQGKVEAVCEMCSRAKAEAFCRQCTDFICNSCVGLHQTLKVFAGHKVVTLQELKEGGAKEISLKEAPPSMCKDHDEQLKIYCFDCSHLICRDCIVRDHAAHKFEFVKKSAPEYKKALKDSLTPLTQIQTNISAATREIEKVEKEVSEQHKSVTGTIQRSFNQLHDVLRKREKQLLERASELKQQKLDSLGAQRKGFALATSDIQGLMEFVERSVTNATDEEVMLLQKDIQEKIREQREKHERIDLVPAEVANIGVRVACAEGISDLCQKNTAVMLQADPTKCTAEGPGVKGAEVGKAAQFTVRTVYQNGQLYNEKQIVEAEVVSDANGSIVHTKVISKLGRVYEVTYTPKIRGRHTVVVKVNGTQVAGSPFRVLAKIHPTQLGKPVRVVGGLTGPHQITFNNKQRLVVGEGGGKVIVFAKDGNKIQTIECERLEGARGVAVDKKDDSIYVADGSSHSVLKFSKEGKLVKVVEQRGAQPGEFNTPTSVKIINDKLYICDRDNHRVQILNRDMECVESFGHCGSGDGEFRSPEDLAQDRAGNLYVSEWGNDRVQVLNCKGQFLYAISKKGAGSERLRYPCGICVDDQFVYVCDKGNKCVSVFKTSGEFVTSFGQFSFPVGIALDDGFVHVSDYNYGKVYTF